MFGLLALLPFLASSHAFFILTHPILATTRIDPIVNPGTVSGHVHSIVGGSNFDTQMTYESTQSSKCTTAPITVDKSNYWIPQLYYYNPKTTGYQAISVAYVNTYYLNRLGKNDTVHAFPDGLRMISGDPFRRTFDNKDIDDQAISFVCLDFDGSHIGDPAWAQRNSFFTHNCPGGMRAQINFPNCWSGKELDSADHRSHMAFPLGDSNGNGDCPSTHPIKLVELFYEFIYEVQKYPFNAPGTPTWVWANGDTTGYGLHGDFLNGWPSLVNGTNVLQRAINECDFNQGVGGNLEICPPFQGLINRAQADGCQPQNPLIAEDVGLGHEIPSLPGNNVMWIGNSTDKPDKANYTEPETVYTSFKSVLPANTTYVGCIAEATNGRALTAYSFSSPNMTRGLCAATCQARGFPLSASEFGNECYCDFTMQNGASNTTLLKEEQCNVKCQGSIYENCGGSRTLTLYVNPYFFPSIGGASSLANPSIAAGVDGWVRNTRNCIAEPASKRALVGYATSNSKMTSATCMALCQTRGFTIAGTEYGSECWCSNALDSAAKEASMAECNMPCSGAPGEMCGAGNRLSLYTFNSTIVAPTLPKDWAAAGCWDSRATSGKSFSGFTFSNSNMTNEVCMDQCLMRGFAYAGIEYGSECRCGASYGAGSVQKPGSDCNMLCPANSKQLCGSGDRMTTFKYNGVITAPVAPNNAAVKIDGWTEKGCYTEGTSVRALTGFYVAGASMTIPVCLAACKSRGFKIGGLEYGSQCFCGDTFNAGAVPATEGCTMTCPGDRSTMCGGGNRLNVFFSDAPASTTSDARATSTTSAAAVATPSAWSYKGCYSETQQSRAVSGLYKTTADMTSAQCQAFAVANNHTWASVTYSRECFTGLTLSTKSNLTADAECNYTCGGNAKEYCGATNRATVFQLVAGPVQAAPVVPTTSTSTTSTTSSTSSTTTSPTTTAVTTTKAATTSATTTANATTAATATTTVAPKRRRFRYEI